MPNRDDILDRRMLSLSGGDHLSLRDLVEGTLITGAPGSGKTTTSGKQLAYALLRTRRAGGLTATFMADIIGKEYRYLDSYNAGGGDAGNSHASVGGAKHLSHIVEPIEFSRLVKPAAANPCSEAIVYQSGKPFNASKTERNPKGRNYLRVMFSRDI